MPSLDEDTVKVYFDRATRIYLSQRVVVDPPTTLTEVIIQVGLQKIVEEINWNYSKGTGSLFIKRSS